MTTIPLHISTDWERPALPAGDGSALLMIRIVASVSEKPVAAHRAAIDLAFVIDRSGSMSGRPLELAKRAVSQAAGMLDSRDRAALVVYDSAVDVLQSLSKVDAQTRNELRQVLNQIDAGSTTNLCDGWLTGCQELARHIDAFDQHERIRRAILLTDGLANEGETSPTAIFHHASELRQRGITTTTLGMGAQFDHDLLSGMAEAGGGSFVYLESADHLVNTFERELGRLTTTTATKINLRLRLPDGVRGELLNRFPVDRHGRQFDIALDDLVAGDEVGLIFAITSHDLRVGNHLPVEVSLRWTNPLTSERRTQTAPISPLEVIDERRYATMPAVAAVTAQTAILRAANDQRAAMELDRAGHYAESRAMHAAAFDLLQAAPLEADDVHLIEEAHAYAAFDANVPFSEHARKQSTANSFSRTRRRSVVE